LLQVPLQLPDSAMVYHVRPNVDVPVTLGVSLGSLFAYLYAKNLITPRCPCDPNEVNRFDRGAIGHTSSSARALSDITAGAAIIVPLVADALDLGRGPALNSDAVVFAQTIAINGALVTLAKYVFVRPLPRTYAGDPALIARPEGYRSFYSGHTSLVFAALTASAMTIRLRYGEKTWPWVVVVLAGASVGIERVADGRHFPSDVLVGAAMGTAVGYIVPRLHALKNPRFLGPNVRPIEGGGLALGVSLRF
ncbi:MAG TPA: phosphatase PAP2 family protein, partial [Gemmatimonadales bacterium]|nr:phosphatase PAP2 family protein [Gemmatimonadales bacterium]